MVTLTAVLSVVFAVVVVAFVLVGQRQVAIDREIAELGPKEKSL